MRDALERARVRGEARGSFDIELLLDMLSSPFYFRTLLGHAPLDRRMTRQVVDDLLKIVARDR
jgi:hypothetical protein